MLSTKALLTEADVLTFDADALDTFGASQSAVSTNLALKRQIAVQDWLHGHLRGAGYDPGKHTVLYPADAVLTSTGGTLTDRTSAASDKTTDDVPLASVFATPGTDVLYVGLAVPYRGLMVNMHEAVNANASVLTAQYWDGGAWTAFASLVNGTERVSGKTFSGGGLLTWSLPEDWAKRPISGDTSAAWRYYLRLKVSAALTSGTAAVSLLPVRRSRLTTPAAFYALHLLYSESWGVQRGEWERKADSYRKAADDTITLALKDLQEFDTEDTEAVSTASTPESPDPDLTTWERG